MGRPFTCQSAGIVFNNCFPLFSPLEGKFNPYVSDSFTSNSSQCYTEKVFEEQGKFLSFFHFLVTPPQFPPPSLCGPGLSFGHKSPPPLKAAAELRSQPRIFQWVCNLANTGPFIPIKWKSKHIFCRNPTPIDPSCLLPLPCYSQ